MKFNDNPPSLIQSEANEDRVYQRFEEGTFRKRKQGLGKPMSSNGEVQEGEQGIAHLFVV